MGQGNLIAYAAMLFFPFVGIFLFRKFSVDKALVWTFFLGYLFLPVKTIIDLPAVPTIDKYILISLVAYGLARLFTNKPVKFLPEHKGVRILLVGFILSMAFTSLTNTARIVYGPTVLPGHDLFSGVGISAMAGQFFVIIPFILGRQFLSSTDSMIYCLQALVVVGVLYSLLVFWEIRMSPQLHTKIYGYFPHPQFIQQMRDDGFRAVVFIGHGLLTSMFLVGVFTATLYFVTERKKVWGKNAWLILGFITVAIVFNKTYAAYAYTILVGIVFGLCSKSLQKLCLLTLCVLILVYPAYRSSDLFPGEYIVTSAAKINPDRAESLDFRFGFEDLLLDRAKEKPIFGWGLWGRYRIFDSFGNDITVLDGEWVETLGERGWFGYIAYFGTLLLPVVLLVMHSRKTGEIPRPAIYLSCIVVIVAFNTLINSGIAPWVWLFSGALLGYTENRLKESRAQVANSPQVS